MMVSTLMVSSGLIFIFLPTCPEARIHQDQLWYSTSRQSLNEPLSGGSGLHCLRLYQQRWKTGDWADFCNSNELLPSCFFWNSGSACAPPQQWWQRQTYWLLFEGPFFNGRYALLQAGECKQDLRRMGLQSVGSVLICEQANNGYISCQVPTRPWRQYNAVGTFQQQRSTSTGSESTFAALASGTPTLNIEGQLSLAQLQTGQLKDQ
ncbi:unnamed protein product [Schistocephalus solidus]|uniref:IL4_i_Ig domain-containing protein n=1 Tax=Schistocephalus solidus TaxID=70667 RepID=A0A183SMB8_SCHSO|nr:unnamed protein product [Schistocephalus solidus]